MTRRLKIVLAYDGRPYAGWQSQAGKDAVQDFVEAALAKLCDGKRIPLHGSGRTDAGVHALAQCAHADVPAERLLEAAIRGFSGETLRIHAAGRTDTGVHASFQVIHADLVKDWSPDVVRDALNAHLVPHPVTILSATRAAADFHARFYAKGKRYIYRIWNNPVLPPLEIGRAWQIPLPLDIERLRAAAAIVTGTHDFAAFAANRGVPCPDTVRTIHGITVKGRPGGLITLAFEGNGFLYKMVRLLTGSVVRVAQRRAEPEWLAAFLAPPPPGKPRAKSSFAAPAEGLYLARVFY